MTGRFAWMLALVGAVGYLSAGPAGASPITTPAGLTAGDQFRLVFVSSDARNGRSADLADYDAFIEDLAAASGLDTYAGAPVTWRALGSTAAVDAVDRLPQDFGSPPLYRLDGELVAPSTGVLWVMGTTASRITVTETGVDVGSEASPRPPSRNRRV